MEPETESNVAQLRYLVGRENRKVDSKGRTIIPPKIWNGNRGDCVYMRIRKERTDYFDIIPEPYFDKFFADRYCKLDIDDLSKEDFFGSLFRISLYSQNRITLPAEVRKAVKESGIVSFVGIGSAIRVRP